MLKSCTVWSCVCYTALQVVRALAVLAMAACMLSPCAAQTFEQLMKQDGIPVVSDQVMLVGFDDELAQIADPAIETVDEMTDPGKALSQDPATRMPLTDELQRRWNRIRDPSIETVDEMTKRGKEKDAPWYERINLRGYTQFRINSVLWDDEALAPPYHPGDRSVAPLNHFFIRRCRLIISGNLSERLYVYIQPDFASSVPGALDGAINYAQLRDCYGDVHLTTDKVNRIRVGLSKVPYGWDNMQSSSNRIPLDRTDPINSVTNGERGMGVFYYWTPEHAQDLYKMVLDEGLKGSGNYGVFGIGVYNGQGMSRAEANENMHFVMRLEVPWQMDSGQVIEAGVQAYTGKYTPYTGPITYNNQTVTPVADPSTGVLDQRIGTTLVYYPQPFGFTTEWNVGDGPQLSNLDGTSPANPPTITSQPLTGGYVLLNYKYDSPRWGTMFPFFRWQMYKGGYLWERNSPDTYLDEFNLGLEWQFTPQIEFTTEYDWVNRTNTSSRPVITNGEYAQFKGDLLRFQFQMNY